jgi:protein-L-isoaspartate(D-aspartate) O-methyltransferase
MPLPTLAAEPDLYREARLQMVRLQIEKRGVVDQAVLAAMRTVPRHLFVPPEWIEQAYQDHPLPIGHGQTISQPYIVAWMTELLQVKPGDKILEIGTGSGYQASVLAELECQVYTIEIVEALAVQAAERLAERGYGNITTRHGDGYFGWEEVAPFDAIIVTCAPDHIPPPLVQQLKEGGRMVVPVGPPGGYQSMFLVTKENGEVKSQNLGGVRFVPLTR